MPSADGRSLLIQADRDGDTVSTERGVSVVDLTRKITVADVLARARSAAGRRERPARSE